MRHEIQKSLSFTPKETDIYKIHQTGDLTNLDGLDDASLARLPSLLRLRNALYSSRFRDYLSSIAGAGPLSGRKTDMAINVYIPGCHLLCHDDVIGSRRVSYILYLTDPDRPWEPEWGGGLRLYPTDNFENENGSITKLPRPDSCLSIPPAFNQLSFFAVQPGESFHDVEEVFARQASEQQAAPDSERVRMAISGWYHIPQEGEDGFSPGLEEQLAEKSSLVQLQSKANRFDLPEPRIQPYGEQGDGKGKGKGRATIAEADDNDLSEADLDLLIKYIKPAYLTPDTLDRVQEQFADESGLRLEGFLCDKFAGRLRQFVENEERETLPDTAGAIEKETSWRVARPPHKHRFLYQHSHGSGDGGDSRQITPLQELLGELFPSVAFRKWLSLATQVKLENHNVLARRFRRGRDYMLASGGDTQSRVEVSLGITPTPGWDDEEEGVDQEQPEGKGEQGEQAAPSAASARKPGGRKTDDDVSEDKAGNVGGYEVYMAGDDDDDNGGDGHGGDAITPMDPAVYRSSSGVGDADGGILFSTPASWNQLSVVLRDQGVLRFVKYVSRSAKGDRWDIFGEYGAASEDEDDDDDVEDAMPDGWDKYDEFDEDSSDGDEKDSEDG